MTRIAHLLSGAPAPSRSGAVVALLACAAAGAVLAAPLGVGYAAPSRPTAPPGSAAGIGALNAAGSVEAVREAEQAALDAEQAALEAGQALHDAEEAARAAEAAAHVSEQAAHDAGQAADDAEQDAREAEAAAQMEEQAARNAEQVARDAEQAVRAEARRVAPRSVQAPRAPHAVQPVAAVPGFTGRTGVQPVNAEVAATPMGQASQALVRLVAADPRVASRLGTPVAVTPDGFTGSWRAGEEAGSYSEVDLTFTLTGPQGQARVWGSAMQEDGQWRLTGLDVRAFTPSH